MMRSALFLAFGVALAACAAQMNEKMNETTGRPPRYEPPPTVNMADAAPPPPAPTGFEAPQPGDVQL